MQKLRLQNDCWYSGIQVFPKNWNTTRASLRENWYIWYRFYDPAFADEKNKGVKKVIIKAGINEYKEREDRQAAIRLLFENERNELEVLGYNPFTKQYMASMPEEVPEDVPEDLFRISSEMPWTAALEKVRHLMTVASCTQDDLKCTALAAYKAAIRLRIEGVPVGQIKRVHLKRTLEQMQADSKTRSVKTYNRHRTYMLMLFEQLLEEEAIEHNPVTSIKKKPVTQSIEGREELTLPQRIAIDNYLGARYPEYRNFFRIFFKSGSRFTEMVQLQGKHVNLKKQEFKVLVKKGKVAKWDVRVIADSVLPEWEQAMMKCSKEQFVFGTGFGGLGPSDAPRTAESLSRFWKKKIKHCPDIAEFPDMAGITADAYSLKHSNANEIADSAGIALAALAAGHSSTSTTLRHYATRHQEKVRQSERELLKRIDNSFAPKETDDL